jgi:uncharacterized membrane protein YtjA (UPF0391 family)
MLKWILIAALVAIVAGALGFRGVAKGASSLALILTGIALFVVIVTLLLFAWAGGGWM